MTYMKNIFTIHLPTEAVSLCWIIRNKPELIKTVNLIYPISVIYIRGGTQRYAFLVTKKRK